MHTVLYLGMDPTHVLRVKLAFHPTLHFHIGRHNSSYSAQDANLLPAFLNTLPFISNLFQRLRPGKEKTLASDLLHTMLGQQQLPPAL